MKIVDHISRSIQEYPTLYKDIDYEKSKLKVLNHIFFTNGNGLEIAYCENPNDGGYVVEPKYIIDKKTGDQIRIKDIPYGKEKFRAISNEYFENIVYYVFASGERPIKTVYRKEKYGYIRVYFQYNKKVDSKFKEPKLYKAESLGLFSPYPLSKYSIACEIFDNDMFLQKDWMLELIILIKRTLEYFNDENQYRNNDYYPSENKIKQELIIFNDRFKKNGLEGVNDVRKIWGYDVKETLPDYEEIKINKNKSWEIFREGQLEFLYKFLEKYNI